MKTFTLEIPDFYEHGGICVILMAMNENRTGINATNAMMDLTQNEEMYVTDGHCLSVREVEDDNRDNP